MGCDYAGSAVTKSSRTREGLLPLPRERPSRTASNDAARVEITINRLKSRFRIFKDGRGAAFETSEFPDALRACALIHNFCIDFEDRWEQGLVAEGLGDDSESDQSESDDDENDEGFGDVGAAPAAAHVWQGGGVGAPVLFPFLTDIQETHAGAMRHAQCADECLALDQEEAAAAADDG